MEDTIIKSTPYELNTEADLILKSFRQWLSGNFVCRICKKEYNLTRFGFGEIMRARILMTFAR